MNAYSHWNINTVFLKLVYDVRDMIKARIASDNELSSLSPNVIPNISATNKLNAPFSRNYYDRETKREK